MAVEAHIELPGSAPSVAATPEGRAPVVALDRVALHYPPPAGDRFTRQARQLLSTLVNGERIRDDGGYWAVRDVSLRVRHGEAVAVVGLNGSGKSTLLRVIAGVYRPTRGTVTRTGRTALLSRGLGFRDELSGRENILINAGYLGITRREAARRVDQIAAFAEIGDFIDRPLRTYSSGMRGRLGFAIATSIDPEILLMDEALSAGDPAFRAKARKRLTAFLDRAHAVIFVSHSESFIRQTASRVVWMEAGRVRAEGPVGEVMDAYMAFCAARS